MDKKIWGEDIRDGFDRSDCSDLKSLLVNKKTLTNTYFLKKYSNKTQIAISSQNCLNLEDSSVQIIFYFYFCSTP